MSKGVSERDAEPSVPKKVLRTVTPPFRGRRDTGMHVVGIAYFLGLVVLLVPLLPFVAIVWLISKLTGKAARKAPTERLPGVESKSHR